MACISSMRPIANLAELVEQVEHQALGRCAVTRIPGAILPSTGVWLGARAGGAWTQ
jgi:hypothetical protein